jgi:hypothetical protein
MRERPENQMKLCVFMKSELNEVAVSVFQAISAEKYSEEIFGSICRTMAEES